MLSRRHARIACWGPALSVLLVLGAGCGSGLIHDGGDAFTGTDGGATTDGATQWDGAAPLPDGAVGSDAAGQPDAAVQQDAQTTGVTPPVGGSSGGVGGTTAPSGTTVTAAGVTYIIIVPSSYNQATPNRLMIVYSGTEGGTTMASNLLQVAAAYGLGDVIFAVLDGTTYYGNGGAGATVLDDVRARYNIDNDRTFLLSESAGTSAGLQLGLDLRQSYFAVYWANDVNTQATPTQTAAQLGFEPWGNAGPGGDLVDANAIVAGMQSAGYRLPADAPYSGTGSGTHGAVEQFLAAIALFDGKSRL